MEIVITGRRTDVPERYRRQVEEKLGKVTQFAPRAHRIDVEWSRERNPRQSHQCEKVEITVRDKGPVIRAEACAEDFLAALDLASGKLVERLRRLGDKRKVHHGRQTPASVRSADLLESGSLVGTAPVTAGLNGSAVPAARAGSVALESRPGELLEDGLGYDEASYDEPVRTDLPEGAEDLAGSPVVIRTKDHNAQPMTIEQALYEMELVGHDFFLYVDATCGKPCVVYRRRGWNYGVIKLHAAEGEPGPAQPGQA